MRIRLSQILLLRETKVLVNQLYNLLHSSQNKSGAEQGEMSNICSHITTLKHVISHAKLYPIYKDRP